VERSWWSAFIGVDQRINRWDGRQRDRAQGKTKIKHPRKRFMELDHESNTNVRPEMVER